ncbi:MAG: bifunctional methylenetetrahydrofolate dehydrogenase/methenyltetrahydrofolate cyclohydrolase FolD [Candidatus Marinimicrobia bacterium]|nr:bifunctional methylenetetrahydrofolate dehydrogenase/methenyltetrahydrofolate cyclohydrolase FolD [Candidatus Neomarinimicrobiota bacterium]
MEAKILHGKVVAEAVMEGLKARIEKCIDNGIRPGLVVVIVGEDPASQVYVTNKARACELVGIYSETLRLPAETTQKELNELIDQLNIDDRFHGILVQMPLPKHLNEIEIIERISPQKDVDGFHPMSVGRLVQGQSAFLPCTPAGVMEMLAYYNIETKGKHVVIIGRSNIVGKPMLNLMYQKSEHANATVTICHTGTQNMEEHTLRADILIVAAGVPEMIKAGMVKEDAIVIDVGVNRVDDETKKRGYRLVGDVAYDEVKERCSAITPVPGGVGLMTIAMLMKNTVQAAEDHIILKNNGKE